MATIKRINTRRGFLEHGPEFFSKARTGLALMAAGFAAGVASRSALIAPYTLHALYVDVAHAARVGIPEPIAHVLTEHMLHHDFWSVPDLTLLEMTADEIVGGL